MRLVAVLATALCVAAAGCGGSSDSSGSSSETGGQPAARGGTLKLATAHDVTDANQFTLTDNESIRAVSQITEGLYKTDARGQIQPWLAIDDKVSADGRVHTFTLRPDVVFSDGKPMTSADVKFTLDTSRSGETFGFLLSGVKSVEAPARDRVVLRLERPSAALHAVLALFINGIVPKDFGGRSEQQFAQRPVGTGPFMLARWDKGSRFVLDRNPRYWDDRRPLLDRVELIGVPDDNSRVSQLRGKQVDIAVSPPWPQIKSLDSTAGLRVGTYAPSQLYAVALNTKEPAFADPRIREAISLALDRPAMIKASLAGNGQPATSFLAPSVPFAWGPPAQAAQLERARALIEQAGGPPAGDIELILRSGDGVSNTVAQVLQQDLGKIGLRVKLVPLDQAAQLEKYDKGDYTMTMTGMTSDILDPSELVSYYVVSEGFTTGVDTRSVAVLATQAEREADDAKRGELYRQLQQEVHDKYSFVPLQFAPWVYGISDAIEGFAVNGTGIPDLSVVGKR